MPPPSAPQTLAVTPLRAPSQQGSYTLPHQLLHSTKQRRQGYRTSGPALPSLHLCHASPPSRLQWQSGCLGDGLRCRDGATAPLSPLLSRCCLRFSICPVSQPRSPTCTMCTQTHWQPGPSTVSLSKEGNEQCTLYTLLLSSSCIPCARQIASENCR